MSATYCHCGISGSVWCAGANCYAEDVEDDDGYWQWLEQQADAIAVRERQHP